MRTLITCQPLSTHVRAVAHAARVLIAAGHDVRIAAPAKVGGLVSSTYGVPHVEAGRDWTQDGTIGQTLAACYQAAGNPAFFRAVIGYAAEAVEPMASAVTALASEWSPDVILRDSTELGGYVAARILDVPSIGLDVGVHEHSAGIGHELLDLRRELDGDAPPFPEPLLTPAPPGLLLDPAVYGHVQHYRHEDPARAGERLPAWAAGLPLTRPFVYVSLGALLTHAPALTDMTADCYRRIVLALSEMDVSAVIAAGTSQPAVHEIASPYSHIRVMGYAPQPLMLRAGADVFLTHAGFASIREAINHAVPMVAMGLTTDQPANAAHLEDLGLAVALDRDASVQQIRAALQAVLADGTYRTTARAWQRSALALPPLSTVLSGVLPPVDRPA